ncbi:ATPase, V1/A1 complex, subunit E [Mortierella sp. GBAus27b]|nr:V-ATPase V1 sector subunit E [Mortierella sp. GBA43]KAI8363472.1 ATPase, V1/A1 complex, subunit E [Mortierella sp. GBAus27b]
MAYNKALNDQEVRTELDKMISFIGQEAREKAREIKVKADEEFNIEKAKLVRQEAVNIDAVFQRKIKQADVQRRIAQSNNINKARMKLLVARQELLDQLFADARKELVEVAKDASRYEKYLGDALVQSLFRLLESEVIVQHRKADEALLKKLIPDVQKRYEERTQQSVKIELSSDHLPSDGAGGVIVAGHEGKIKCDNTPEARLAILEQDMLPDIRVMLFGPSPNRKFFN